MRIIIPVLEIKSQSYKNWKSTSILCISACDMHLRMCTLGSQGNISCDLFSVSLHRTPLQGFSLSWSYCPGHGHPCFLAQVCKSEYMSSGLHSKLLFICWAANGLTSGFYCVFVCFVTVSLCFPGETGNVCKPVCTRTLIFPVPKY